MKENLLKTRYASLIFFALVWTITACSSPQTTTTATQSDPLVPTATPELFSALTQAVPGQVQLNGTMLAVQETSLVECDLPNCPPAPTGLRYLRVTLQALNLPADRFLDYKNLPQGIAIRDNTGTTTPFNRITAYKPSEQQLILYFTVPENASEFGLQWPAAAEIPLTVAYSETPTAQP